MGVERSPLPKQRPSIRNMILYVFPVREAAKSSFFNGRAINRWGGVKGRPLRKKERKRKKFFDSHNARPLKKDLYCGFPKGARQKD